MTRSLSFALVLLAALAAPPAAAETEVVAAVRAGDLEAARSLLRAGADVNAAEADGSSALHWAALGGDLDLARMLVHAGAHLGARSRLGGYTPLHLAAQRGDGAMIEELVAAGAEVDARTHAGSTPLMLAAGAGSRVAVAALVAAGADVDAIEETHGQTALMFAADRGRVAALETLIAAGADPAVTTRVVDAVELEKAQRAAARKRAAVKRALAAQEEEEAEQEEDQKEEEPSSPAATAETPDEAPASAEVDDPELAAERERRGQRRQRERCDPYASRERVAKDPNQGFELASDPAPPDTDAVEIERVEVEKEVEESKPCPLTFGQLVGKHGGMSALHYAARQGHRETVVALLDGGADVDQATAGDGSTPLLIATINGHFDLAMLLLERGADPRLASAAGATPLYAAVNVRWAPHSFYPQPSPAQEETSHLELMQALLDRGADPDARLEKKLWYTGYNFDQSGVDEAGATAFWRAAQAADVEAMRLLVAAGADPSLPSIVVPERRLPNGRNADADLDADPPELGGPAVTPLQMASGAGYVGNYHQIAPGGFLPAVRYLVEELGADPAAADHRGYTPLHNAAARGDNEMIRYLVAKGGDVTAVTRDGMTTADLANGPVQRIQPFPETIELLVSLGAVNNDRCVSC